MAGGAVLKQAIQHGDSVARYIASLPDARSADPNVWDLIIAGAGAAGLNAAITAKKLGLRVMVLEKNKIANTVEDFPEGKWIYAEPAGLQVDGELWFQEATKEELLSEWHRNVRENALDIRTGEEIGTVRRKGNLLEVVTPKGRYAALRVILATGLRGNPRRLNVPGEDRAEIHHRLYSPKAYKDKEILVVGGGNSAVEAALALSEQNRVTLSYRGKEFSRLFAENRRKLNESENIRVLRESWVTAFKEGFAQINGERIACDHAFVLIGADPPREFLRSIGVKLEREWTWKRYLYLALAFALVYSICGNRMGHGHEFWPFRGWGFKTLSFLDRPWGFWCTVAYTALVTIFGFKAMKRWGFDYKDRFQIWRYSCLIGFQWTFFFLIPEFLFPWLARRFSSDPNFIQNTWRSYGIIYAWPLFFYTFVGNPPLVWVIWGLILSFLLMPLLALFHGKRYCSWICGCGGLAESFGDRWRHLAPKGRLSIQWEWMNDVVLAAGVFVTILMLVKNYATQVQAPAEFGIVWYRLLVDVWLVAIVPLTFYPFFGGKVWCRYWCPLARMIEVFSQAFTRFGVSRFAIQANEKCILCGECTHYCQVGIDVMNFASRQQEINNLNSSCIGCGICVTVCPMNVLEFGRPRPATQLVQISSNGLT